MDSDTIQGVRHGRTASPTPTTGPLALFLIGLRVHKPWKVGIVRPGRSGDAPDDRRARGATRRAAERGEAESPGLPRQPLDPRPHGAPRSSSGGAASTDIYAYANAADPRAPARRGSSSTGAAKADPTAVTIWHETYAVEPGGVESVYGGPGAFGLADLAGDGPDRPARRDAPASGSARRSPGSVTAEPSAAERQAVARSVDAQAHTRASISGSPVAACTSQASARSVSGRPPVLPGDEPLGQQVEHVVAQRRGEDRDRASPPGSAPRRVGRRAGRPRRRSPDGPAAGTRGAACGHGRCAGRG